MYTKLLKPLLDFLGALVLVTAAMPIIAVLYILSRIFLGSPVFFRQPRPGLNGKIFTLYKFRTMTNEMDDNGELLPDEKRLHGFGLFLRRSSLDELPQLFNILKGDMSFVGPRPLLVEYLPLYSPQQAKRHEVKPGITGWAQVNGRNAISWDEKFRLDVWYVDNQNFVLDIKIFWMTLIKTVKKEGISQEGHSTMEKFRGNA